MLFKIVFVALAIKANECALYEPSDNYCVSSCVGKADGGYPSCLGNCNNYVMCSDEYLEEKSCPLANNSYGNEQLTQWDQTEQKCVEASSLCPVPIGKCIVSCEGIPDGNYQSCTGCYGYVSCVGESLYNMQCSATLLWDDGLKRCEDKSNTCPPGQCVDDCTDRPDGNYQKCDDPYYYVSCSGGYLTYNPCPSGLVWDDSEKRCENPPTSLVI